VRVPGPNLASAQLPPRQPRFCSLIPMADRWAVKVSLTTTWPSTRCGFGMGPTCQIYPLRILRTLFRLHGARMDIGMIRPWIPPTSPSIGLRRGVKKGAGTLRPSSISPRRHRTVRDGEDLPRRRSWITVIVFCY
jgi:hypothetical protein